jgi:tetratricopeptide (TPR) repeat protein
VGNLGALLMQQGDLRAAAHRYREALELARRIGSRAAEAINLANLGEVYHGLGRPELARTQLTRALALHSDTGGRGAQAEAMRLLAAVHQDSGLAEQALALTREAGDRLSEAHTLNTLGELYQRGEQWARAADCHAQALALAREIGSSYPEVVALLGQAAPAARRGGAPAGIPLARRALELARRGGFGLLQGQAHTALAALLMADDAPEDAAAEAREALSILEGTGHRAATAHAREVLAEAIELSAGTHRPDQTARGARSGRNRQVGAARP